jgi:hypothetical protein
VRIDEATDEPAASDDPSADGASRRPSTDPGRRLGRALVLAEDALYGLVGLVFVGLTAAILVNGVVRFVGDLRDDPDGAFLRLLAQALLALIVVELLYRVVVWLRGHALRPDPSCSSRSRRRCGA